MTDIELAENYEQNARLCGEWIREARKKEKELLANGDPEGAKSKQLLILGLREQKEQLLEDAARLRGGPAVGIKGRSSRGGSSKPPRKW